MIRERHRRGGAPKKASWPYLASWPSW